MKFLVTLPDPPSYAKGRLDEATYDLLLKARLYTVRRILRSHYRHFAVIVEVLIDDRPDPMDFVKFITGGVGTAHSNCVHVAFTNGITVCSKMDPSWVHVVKSPNLR